MKLTAKEIKKNLKRLGSAALAEHSQRFFKTGKGEYGEGDKFIGIKVPVIRQQVKKYQGISVNEVLLLLKSSFHEERLFALIMLVKMFSKGNDEEKEEIYKHYLNNIEYINNWDLVDSSAHYIVGAHLYKRDRHPIYNLAKSKNLWKRRVAIISTFYFIRKDEFTDALQISEILKNDKEDLIHKAVGWMLREVGKRDLNAEKFFLNRHYREMPRTMLRYAIERFSKDIRISYLRGEI